MDEEYGGERGTAENCGGTKWVTTENNTCVTNLCNLFYMPVKLFFFLCVLHSAIYCILLNAAAPDLQPYLRSLPASVRPFLDKELGWDHEGVERDLCEIADHMSGWEERLSVHLGLTLVDIFDIKLKYPDQPVLQRHVIIHKIISNWMSERSHTHACHEIYDLKLCVWYAPLLVS